MWGHITDHNYAATLSSGKVTGFDITGLVKYWKTGKYSADAGFILINSTETKNKSFCSSEYGTTSYRPYVEMTYEVDLSLSTYSTEVAEGGTVTINATTNPSGQTVTWKIVQGSATIVAYSNTSCTVKGVKAGDAKLEASITTADGKKVSKYCDIYVHLVDGVYYIKNMNSGYCLEVPNGSILDYTKVTQASQYSSTTSEVTRLRQMWKVKYMEDGSYSIRPLHNAEMGLYWDGNLMVWNIGTVDTVNSINKNAQWTIHWDGSGYVVKQHGNNVTAVMQVSGASKASGANIITGTDAGNANCRWTFTKVSNVPTGIVLYDTSTGQALSGGATRAVAVDEIRTLEDLKLKAVVYTGDFKNYGITWSLPNLSYCNYVDVDSSTGTVIGLEEKSVTITATSVLYNGPKSTSYTLKIIPVRTGTYFIKNRQFSKYLQIDNNDAANDYKSLGVIMEQWTYDGEDYQKWKLVSLENGYYKIISVQSGLALSVPSGKTSAQDVELIQEIYTGDSRQQWKITQTQYGSYKIKPRSAEGLTNDLVMAVGDSITVGWDGTNIEQRVYANNTSYMDEWYIRNPYYATVNIYYDMGYCVRYDVSKEEAAEKIGNYMREVADIYEDVLGLKVLYNVSYYESELDKCKGTVTDENVDELCEHGGTHSLRSNVIKECNAAFEGSDTVTNIYMSGHKIVYYTDKNGNAVDGITYIDKEEFEEKEYKENINVSCSSGSTVLVIGIHEDLSEEDLDYKAKRGFLHELNHQYELLDHYHKTVKTDDGEEICKHKAICSKCGDNPRPIECVMGHEAYADGKLIICDECKKDIISHLQGHHNMEG